MQVTVRYFAILRERRGTAEERVDVPDGITVGALFRRLFPESETPLPGMARNRSMVGPESVVEPGDEIAFLPPLGGG